MTSTVRVGILGHGNVGGALVRLLLENHDAITQRTDLHLEIRKIAVRDTSRHRHLGLPRHVFTDDAQSVVTDSDVDVIIELIGGVEPARQLITTALELKKPVVTANKALLAEFGCDLGELASRQQVDLLYEGAVGGGIPIMRPLRESLAGEQILRLMGIVNGTTNYVLTRMTEDGASYEDALAEAQRNGYAEADTTADVEGLDAAAKIVVLASVAFGLRSTPNDVYREGISGISSDDIDMAGRLGYVVKLLAVAEKHSDGRVGVRVHPTMVPKNHPLASVRLAFNALYIEGASVGELMFYGQGAGGVPTASAVLGDVIDACRNWTMQTYGRHINAAKAELWPVEEQRSSFYINLAAVDRPAVLAAIATLFGKHGVSIRSMEQIGLSDEARLVFITHGAIEHDMKATLRNLRELDVVRRIANVVRVLGDQ